MNYIKLSDCACFRDARTRNITLENYITTENMLPNRGGVKVIESLPSIKSASKYEIDDILLSNIRPYFCKIWHANRNGSCSNDVLVLQVNNEHNSKFIYYVLSDNNFFNYSTVTSKGTKMPRGTPKAIMKYVVPEVELKTETKIAEILSRYDELIEVNNQRIKKLEQTAEELYKEWFVRFRFPNWQNTEFENGIPKGWKVKKCKSIMPILTGKKDVNYGGNEGKYPFFTCAQKTFKAPDYSFDCCAVLLAGNCDLNVKLFKGKFEAYQRTYVLSPYDVNLLFVLYYTIKNNVSSLKQSSTGAAISFITKGMIERIRIIIPNNELLLRFNNTCNLLLNEKNNLKAQNENLIKQRNLLLPRLMSGKLEV